MSSGGFLIFPFAIAVGPDRSIYVGDVVACALIRINPVSGEQEIAARPGEGGATWCDPSDIAAEADGQAILTDFASQRTHRVDPTTDISDVIWDFFTEGVAVAADGPIGDSKPRMDELARYWTVGDLWFE